MDATGGLGGGLFAEAFGGVHVEFAGCFDQTPDGDGGEDHEERPETDEDGGSPFFGEARPETQDGFSVVNAESRGDGVACEAAEGEGRHEFFARHVDCACRQYEGRQRHGRWEDRG